MQPAVKFIEGSDSTLEGLALPYGGPLRGKDLQGERFTPDTDYVPELFPNEGRPVLYDHGLDEGMKLSIQGRQIEHDRRDEGIWATVQLDRSAKYHTAVSRLVRAGKLFFSSGTMNHLAQTDRQGNVKRWPWFELSLTATPANPYAAAHFIKSSDLLERLAEIDTDISPALVALALKALDDSPEDTDELRAGSSYADDADRLLSDVAEFRDRSVSLVDLRAKSGRVLSRSTRERLARHPGSLRELADDLDTLLSDADAEKLAGKSNDLITLQLETERQLSRSLGVPLT